jgi:ribosomal protein S18 acetylase RimI-like enzyme
VNVQIRALGDGDADALRDFFAAVPAADRTFFKDDVTEPTLAQRWVDDRRSVRRLAVGHDGGIVAFAALSPGVERTSHVADLRLVVAAPARGRGLGRSLARQMLLEAVGAGFRKVTVDLAAESTGAIEMFRGLGFVPEALLRDHLCDPTGELHDLLVLAHAVDENWSAMAMAGIGDDVG